MKMKILSVLAGVAAAAGCTFSGPKAENASCGVTGGGTAEISKAVPPVSGTGGLRRPGPARVMVIGAHPDDADIFCGGLALRLIDRGFKVKFVSMTDGRMGHHVYSPDETAKVRRKETLEAARRMKLDGYDIYGYPDCGLFPTDEARKNVARKIREYQPDYIITHRTCDYHADHRATGQLVTDACYLLGVPHWCPEVPAQRHRPVIFYMTDAFTNPRPIRPDLMFDVDNYIERLCDGLDAQGSQIYEWLPWDSGREKTVAALGDRSDIKARNEYINRYTFGRKRADAKRFAEVWKEKHPDCPLPKNLEVYEISEYGRRPSKAELSFLSE